MCCTKLSCLLPVVAQSLAPDGVPLVLGGQFTHDDSTALLPKGGLASTIALKLPAGSGCQRVAAHHHVGTDFGADAVQQHVHGAHARCGLHQP